MRIRIRFGNAKWVTVRSLKRKYRCEKCRVGLRIGSEVGVLVAQPGMWCAPCARRELDFGQVWFGD